MIANRWVLAGTMGALLLAPAVLRAQPPSLAEMKAEQATIFTQADADGSGTLTLEEYKTFESLMRDKMTERHFTGSDTDSDGVLSLEEIQAAGPGRGPGPGGPWHP